MDREELKREMLSQIASVLSEFYGFDTSGHDDFSGGSTTKDEITQFNTRAIAVTDRLAGRESIYFTEARIIHIKKECDACDFLSNPTPETQILDTQYWSVGIDRKNHAYLGRAYVTLKGHKSSPSNLSQNEWKDISNPLLKS